VLQSRAHPNYNVWLDKCNWLSISPVQTSSRMSLFRRDGFLYVLQCTYSMDPGQFGLVPLPGTSTAISRVHDINLWLLVLCFARFSDLPLQLGCWSGLWRDSTSYSIPESCWCSSNPLLAIDCKLVKQDGCEDQMESSTRSPKRAYIRTRQDGPSFFGCVLPRPDCSTQFNGLWS
jgi:hypothetical protein